MNSVLTFVAVLFAVVVATALCVTACYAFLYGGSHKQTSPRKSRKEKEKEEVDKILDNLLNKAFVPVSEKKDDTGPKDDSPVQFVPKSVYGNGKCMYCGKELIGIGANPHDYGLQSEYIDFSDKGVCPRCDELVTQTNRYIGRILQDDFAGRDSSTHLMMLRSHIAAVTEYDYYRELQNRGENCMEEE